MTTTTGTRHSKSGQGPDPRFKRAGGTGFRASGTGFRASGTGIKAGGTGIRASGTGIWPKVGLNSPKLVLKSTPRHREVARGVAWGHPRPVGAWELELTESGRSGPWPDFEWGGLGGVGPEVRRAHAHRSSSSAAGQVACSCGPATGGCLADGAARELYRKVQRADGGRSGPVLA